MTYAFVYCNGFEFKALQTADVLNTTPDFWHYTTDTPGAWSRYAWNSEQTVNSAAYTMSLHGGAANNMWVNFNLKPVLNAVYFDFHDDIGTRHLRLGHHSSGKMELWSGVGSPVSIALSTHVIDLNVWHSMALFLNIADAGQVILVVDGQEEINFSGDTRNAGNANVGDMMLINQPGFIIDDVIFGTGTTADNPGTAKVYGLVPNGVETGGVHQMLKSQLTAQRFYFTSGDPDSGQGPSPPTVQHDGNDAVVSVAPDAGWNQTTLAKHRALRSSKLSDGYSGGTNNSADIFPFSALSTDDDLLMYQFISGPLAAQTITGNVKGQMEFRESDAAGNDRAQIIIRVVSNDGTTVRGTLLAIDTAAIGSDEFASGGFWVNRKIPRGGSVALTNIGALTDGDRLVIEIGSRHTAATTTQNVEARVGSYKASSAGAETDLPEDVTTNINNAPWIEFSNAITLSTTKGNGELLRKFPAAGFLAETTGVYETTVDKHDLYTLTDVSGYDSVVGVVVNVLAKRTDAGSGTLQIGVESGGTEDYDAAHSLGLGYTDIVRRMAVNPVGSVAWTPTNVNSLRAGFRVKA